MHPFRELKNKKQTNSFFSVQPDVALHAIECDDVRQVTLAKQLKPQV